MDNYLLVLQNARESYMSFLTPAMYIISEFAFYAVPLISIILYLCVDKKKYTSLAFGIIISNFLMNFIKLIFCVYRPWVNNSALHVEKIAEHSATGYSFPSGHTTSGAVFYGTLAFEEKKARNRKWVIILFWVMIFITGFSRNWLGAHTLWDVLGGVVIAGTSILFSEVLVKYVDENPKSDIYILVIGCVVSIASMIFYSLKSYPIDYDVNGVIICEPVLMQKDSWLSCGFLIAWLISWFLDRRILRFSTDVKLSWKIARGIIVAIIFGSLYMVIMKKIGEYIPIPQLGYFLRGFVPIIMSVGVFPLIFVNCEKHMLGKHK